jgi:hypothetical protein
LIRTARHDVRRLSASRAGEQPPAGRIHEMTKVVFSCQGV